MLQLALVLGLSATGLASTLLWDGRLNDLTTSAPLADWTWFNTALAYQYYLHGPEPIASYISLSPTYKNPADTATAQGARISIDNTSHYWYTTPLQTALLPQTSAPIASGKVWYHFSLRAGEGDRAPDPAQEHLLFYFVKGFAGLTYGGTGAETLAFVTGNETRWSTPLAAGQWLNFAYEIDFGASEVGLWTSTGAGELQAVVPAVCVADVVSVRYMRRRERERERGRC